MKYRILVKGGVYLAQYNFLFFWSYLTDSATGNKMQFSSEAEAVKKVLAFYSIYKQRNSPEIVIKEGEL